MFKILQSRRVVTAAAFALAAAYSVGVPAETVQAVSCRAPRARRDGPRVVRGASPAGNGPAAPKTGSVRLSRPLCGLLGLCRLERWRLP